MENEQSAEKKQAENLDEVGNVTEDSSLNTDYVEPVEEAETEELTDEETPEIPTENAQLEVLTSVHSLTSYTEVHEATKALNDMKVLAQQMIQAKLCRLKSVPDVVLAIITGKQYGFNFITSVNNIYPINGTPTMSTHIIRAQLLRNKIFIEKIYDNEPMYQYYKGIEKEGKVETVKVLIENKEVPIPLSVGTLKDIPNEPHVRGNNVVDYITKYKFERQIQMPDGTYRTQTVFSSFTLSEAKKAELLDKDNWKKYQGRMLDSRAFNFGAREIADDILLGMYSTSELADAHGVRYEISPTLHETVIQ